MSNKDVNELITAQAEQIEALKALVEEQGKKIAAISDEVPTAVEEVVYETPKETFMVDKVKYRFTVPRYIKPFEGLVVSADILNDTAELERLVTIKSGIVRKV